MKDASPKGFQNNPAMKWTDQLAVSMILLEDLVYISGAGVSYTIPSGFQTDFASVPKVFWNLIPPDADAKFPGILHDYLYSLKGREPYLATRRQSDDLLLEALQLVGAPLLERRTIWTAVRLFGQRYWDQSK